MLASTHPDATAFAARFLANPQDRLGRLVFADWLEERGDDSSMAWAQYLREMAFVEEEFGEECAQQSESFGQRVRARLTLGQVPGTPLLSRLQLFLPAHRVWMRIGEQRIPKATVDSCSEALARIYRFMPIDFTEERVFGVVAVERAEEFDSLIPDVENFLCCRVTAFRGNTEDVSHAIDAHYGRNRRVANDGRIVEGI